MMTENPRRTVVIGLDGVPYGLLDKLSDCGVMSNFKDLKEEGTFRVMRSTVPEVSAVSWSSIITGKNPGEHGVYGFTDLLRGFYVLSFHSSKNLKAPTFWQMDKTCKYVVINLPATYPAGEINGVLVSGFVSPDIEEAVYPREYAKTLYDLNYQIDIDIERSKLSNRILFKQLYKTLDARMKLALHLWDDMDWKVFMLVFTGTDRLEHLLWHAYEDKRHEYHEDFLEYFKAIDNAIGTINSRLSEEDLLVILSDHGMERTEINVNINALLRQEGYLLTEDNPKKGYNSIKRETKAFALDPSRIYLNKKGKYPRGSVDMDEEEDLIQELKELFYDFRWKGKRVIRRVYRKEEIYKGRCVDQAPDLVLIPEKGFNLRARLFSKELFEVDEITGKHTLDDAFLYVKSLDDEKIPENPSVEDVLPILWSLGGLRVETP